MKMMTLNKKKLIHALNKKVKSWQDSARTYATYAQDSVAVVCSDSKARVLTHVLVEIEAGMYDGAGCSHSHHDPDLSERELDLIEIILDLMCQYNCRTYEEKENDKDKENPFYWHGFLGANECAQDMMAELGFITSEGRLNFLKVCELRAKFREGE